MSDPCQFSVSSPNEPGLAKTVVLRVRDHRKVLVEIEMSPGDFTDALLGNEVTAAFTTGHGT